MSVWSQWCVSFPLKPTPLSRATGQEGGDRWAGRLMLASNPPFHVSQAATDQTQRRRRATTPTVLWLALMGLNLQQKKWWRDYRLLFSGFLCWSKGRLWLEEDEEEKKLPGTGRGVRQTNIKKYKTNTVWLARGEGEFPHLKKRTSSDERRDDGEKFGQTCKERKKETVGMKRQNTSLLKTRNQIKHATLRRREDEWMRGRCGL